MTRAVEIRTAKLKRQMHNGQTLCFTTPDLPRPRSQRCRLTFIKPEHVPDFEGEYGWFELERVKAVPWSYWRAVRQVEPPPEWKPPERVKPTPAQLLGHS